LRWLRGKIEENPLTAEIDLDRLLRGLLQSLVREQRNFQTRLEEPQTSKLIEEPATAIVEASS
jgi:hypothetical protein